MAENIETWMAGVLHGPLYTPASVSISVDRGESLKNENLLPRSLTRTCTTCNEPHPTVWQRHRVGSGGLSPELYVGPGWVIAYRCALCERATVSFWLLITQDEKPVLGADKKVILVTATKVGQVPEPLIEPPRAVRKALGEGTKLYRKGLVSLQHGFGLGALAYMRRIVEDQTDALLTLLQEVANAGGDTEKVASIEAARREQISAARLRLAAEALPPTMRVGGQNPLLRLFEVLSADMHNASDQECLDRASELRDTFEFVFVNLRDQLEKARAFQERMKKLGRL